MLQVLRRADVYAPNALGICDLVVSGEKIVWIGKSLDSVPSTLVDEEVDCAGARVIPALIDGHAHLTGGGGESGPGSRPPRLCLSHFTNAGIATCIGVLGTDDVSRTTVDLVACARDLHAEGLSAYCLTGGYHIPPPTLTGTVRGDILNVDRILGVGEVAISDHRSSQPTLDEFLRLSSEAHVGGLMSGKAGIVHIHLGDGVRGLELVRLALAQSELPAHVFHPTHLNRRRALLKEGFELVEQGVVIDVTAFPVFDPQEECVAEDAVQQFFDAGLDRKGITVSSDGGGCLPHFNEEGRVDHMEIATPMALFDCLATFIGRGWPDNRRAPSGWRSSIVWQHSSGGDGR